MQLESFNRIRCSFGLSLWEKGFDPNKFEVTLNYNKITSEREIRIVYRSGKVCKASVYIVEPEDGEEEIADLLVDMWSFALRPNHYQKLIKFHKSFINEPEVV